MGKDVLDASLEKMMRKSLSFGAFDLLEAVQVELSHKTLKLLMPKVERQDLLQII